MTCPNYTSPQLVFSIRPNGEAEALRARIAELEAVLADARLFINQNGLTIDIRHPTYRRIMQTIDALKLNTEAAEAKLKLAGESAQLGQELIEWAASPGLHSKVQPQTCFFCGTQFPNEYEAHADDCLHIRAHALREMVTQ